MFRWFASLIYGRGHVDVIEGLEYFDQPSQRPREVRHESDDLLLDFQKKERLLQELRNAEWILDYEKRLAQLSKRKPPRNGSRAEQVGANTERLLELEHHLAGLRRSLD